MHLLQSQVIELWNLLLIRALRRRRRFFRNAPPKFAFARRIRRDLQLLTRRLTRGSQISIAIDHTVQAARGNAATELSSHDSTCRV
jgi:hypothetical protein